MRATRTISAGAAAAVTTARGSGYGLPTALGVKNGEFPLDIFPAASLAGQRRICLAAGADGFELFLAVAAEILVNGHPSLTYLVKSARVVSISFKTPSSEAFGKLPK